MREEDKESGGKGDQERGDQREEDKRERMTEMEGYTGMRSHGLEKLGVGRQGEKSHRYRGSLETSMHLVCQQASQMVICLEMLLWHNSGDASSVFLLLGLRLSSDVVTSPAKEGF